MNSSLATVVPATDSRQWTDIRQSLLSIHVAGFAAYYALGFTTHRHLVKQDKQYIALPIIYLFFPFLYPCQILVAIPLAVRNRLWRPYQSYAYYMCGILGMCAKRIKFEDPHHNKDDTAERCGPGLLLDYFVPRVRLVRRPWSHQRWFGVFVTIVALYQAISTSILYMHRWSLQGSKLLEIDHRIGVMALGASVSILSYLSLELTSYDWEDMLCTDEQHLLHEYTKDSLHAWDKEHPKLVGGLDVSNKHVYDFALAICLHLIHLHFAGRSFPLFHRTDWAFDGRSVLAILLYSILGLITTPVLSDALFRTETTTFWRRMTSGDVLARIVVYLAGIYLAVVTVLSEIREIQQISNGVVNNWNKNWTWKDPWTSTLWSL